MPAAPFKTPLGLDELRHRTRGLGQRHRTVLLLVDGQRTLGEVLGMAHRAGASTSHFEELVRLGLVEMPVETVLSDPAETAPGALDLPKLTSVEVDVPLGADATDAPPPTTVTFTTWHEPPHDDGPETVGNPEVAPLAALAETPSPPPSVRAPAPSPRVPRRAAAPALAPAPHVELRDPGDTLADHARPRPSVSEALTLQQVRSLLLGSMGGEAALFSPLTLTRIRIAQTSRDLIALVWEIERQRNHVRRSRAQLWSLQKARELLGMGNTLVSSDTHPGSGWPDTASH